MYSGLDEIVRNHKRPTLALLVSELERAYQAPIWSAVSEAALAADVNLLCFVGGRLGGGQLPNEADRNELYELVNANLVDGVIVVASSIAHGTQHNNLVAFVNHFRSLPVISVGIQLAGVPSVTVDSDHGMRAAIRHLIIDHNATRIAFIRGPEGHQESEGRYRVYREELAHYGLPFDADLVAPGDFVSSVRACDLLLNTRGVAFDAVVAANDTMALSAIHELQSRGLRVPQDVAVVGYDDATDSRFSLPPLTTVRQPTAAMGRIATEMILAVMRGESVTDVHLPSSLVIRRSCGCSGASVTDVLTLDMAQSPSIFEDLLPAAENLAVDRDLSVDFDRLGIGRESFGQLLAAFDVAVGESSGSARIFLARLDEVLQQVGVGVDFWAWHQALSDLRLSILPEVVDNPGDLVRVEHLVEQARLLISEVAQRFEASHAIEARRLENAVRDIGLDLLATFDADRLMSVLVAGLPRIDVRGCMLALYQSGAAVDHAASASSVPMPEWAELALLYRDGKRVPLVASAEGDGAWRFRSRAFVPESLMPSGQRYSFVVEPLTFEGVQLGFALFEPGPQDGEIYGTLRGYLSTALQGAQMAGEMQRRAYQLQAAVDVVRTSDANMDPDRFAQHVVNVLLRSLDMHFVGLYLLEDQWASLWAGTGSAGERMLSDGHRLRIGGGSAVGQSAITRQPRFVRAEEGGALLVGDQYLPDTRSELALPLLSRGNMLGVLSLRSTDPKAFRESDVATFATVADQVAGAIENARLFDRTQKALGELEATQSRYQQQAWADYLAVTQAAEYELGADPDGDLALSMTGEVDAAMVQRRSTVRQPSMEGDGAPSALVVPINYSGATIGALGIHDNASRRWTDDEIYLVESVVERMGLAAENLRLLDETQRRVAVEQLTRSVTAEMRQTLNVDQVLQSAVRRIAEAFDAAEVNIRLTVGDADPASGQSGVAGVDLDPADARQQEL